MKKFLLSIALILFLTSENNAHVDHYSKYNYSDLIKYVKSDKKISKGKLNLVLINKQLNAFKTSKFDKKNVLRAFS